MNFKTPIHTSSHSNHVAYAVLFFLIGFLAGYGVGTAYEAERGAGVAFDQVISHLVTKKSTAPIVQGSQFQASADWKTFTSKDFGYSIRYPAEWSPSEKFKVSPDQLVLVSPEAQNGNALPEIRISYYQSAAELTDHMAVATSAHSLEDYLKTQTAKQDAVYSYKKKQIGKYTGFQADRPGIGGIDNFFLEHKGHVYAIDVDSYFTIDDTNNTVGKIISTFTFNE